MVDPCLLIGDIGGTNARFAQADPDGSGYSDEMRLRCADYENAVEAINFYLRHTNASKPFVICLAAAGPIVDQSVRFTNNRWRIDGRELRQYFGSPRVQLLNDFEAIAYSIPLLNDDDLTTVGLGSPDIEGKKDFNIGVLGPGTGLGLAGLLGRAGSLYPVVGEGGHSGFAPETAIQFEVLKQLRERFERVSDERLLSGPGLENIYWALQKIHGVQTTKISPAEIFERALSKQDVYAAESLQLFYEALGQVAGNLAMTLGARDGIYLAGGILKRYPDLLKTSSFRSGFENKGRYRSLMERIPTRLILHRQPGLLGAGYCARQL